MSMSESKLSSETNTSSLSKESIKSWGKEAKTDSRSLRVIVNGAEEMST